MRDPYVDRLNADMNQARSDRDEDQMRKIEQALDDYEDTLGERFPARAWPEDQQLVLEEICAAAESDYNTPQIMTLGTVAAIAGVAVFHTGFDGVQLPCGMYILPLGESGCGKSRVYRYTAGKALEDRQKEERSEHKRQVPGLLARKQYLEKQRASLLRSTRKASEQTVLGDLEEINRGLSEVESELEKPTTWVSGITNEQIGPLASRNDGMVVIASPETPQFRIASGAYSSQVVVDALNSGHDGEWINDSRVGRPDVEVRLRISMIACTQTSVFAGYLNAHPELMRSGFTYRFHMHDIPFSSLRRRVSAPGVSDKLERFINMLTELGRTVREAEDPLVFGFDPGARARIDEWHADLESERIEAVQRGEGVPELEGFYARRFDSAYRIAVNLHLAHARVSDAVVDLDIAERAIEVAAWSEQNTIKAYKRLGIFDPQSLKQRIRSYSFRKNVPEMDSSMLQAALHVPAAPLRAAMKELAAEDDRFEYVELKSRRPGKTRAVIQCNRSV